MRRTTLCFLALVGVAPALLCAQADRRATVSLDLEAHAVDRVKASYFSMDYEGGVAEADTLLRRFPKSRALAAWRVANLARVARPIEARKAADALLARNRQDPWGWFARTFVAEYASESSDAAPVLEASNEAYRRAPTDPDMAWLRVFALTTSDEPERALALIDTVARRGSLSNAMQILRANATYAAATPGPKRNDLLADSAFKLYDAVRRSDPTAAAAYTFAASRMMGSGKNAEAYALARRGAELSPYSLAAHENYWRAIDGRKEQAQSDRDAEVLADVERLLSARGTEPTVLTSASRQFLNRKHADRARELETRILAEHPASATAEWVFVNRYRDAARARYEAPSPDSAATARYQRSLWDFLDRPTHVSERLMGDAYRELFRLTDSTTNADTLLRIVRSMVKYEGINPHVVYADGAIRLAERGRDFAEAEAMTRAGMKAGKAKIDGQRKNYETVGDYAHAADWMSSFMYDALGVVYMRQGRLDDAEKQLAHARDLDPASTRAFYHLGQLAERRARPADAERFYMKGSLVSSLTGNPNRDALQQLFKRRRGSLDGYDDYLSKIAETDRTARRADIAKSRIAAPRKLGTFALRTIDGSRMTLASLRGRVAVINNWGMWCGPCVAEMPELQKLAVQYAADSGVRILTIDNDPNTDALKTWLEKKGYTFTTLLDDGYLRRSNVDAYPTTWFVDRGGRVAFIKQGWSEKLVEEFGWRIEMLRQR